MAASFQQLVFDIIASDRQASSAFDRFRSKVDQTSGSVDKNTAALDKNTKSLDESTRQHHSALIALAGVGAAFAPITAGAAAAGAGVAAFGALAIPSVKKITTALTGPGGLSAGWVTLDNRQRNAVLGVQALGRSYGGLAKTLEPQVFQVFNQGLTEANSLLGPTGKLAHTSGQGISDFLANFSADSGLQHFIAFLSTQARPALDLLGQDVTHLSHTLFELLQSFAGPGMLELRALSAVFTGLDDSITFLSRDAPALTSVALGIGGVALALSKIGALSGVLKITGLSAIAGQMTGFAAATKGATVAEKGLLATTTAFDAITPWGWVALGVAALGGLAYAMSRIDDGSAKMITSLEQQDKASGFNTQGWRNAAAAIGDYNQKLPVTVRMQGENARSIASVSKVSQDYAAAQQKINDGVREQNSFLDTLEGKYGLTRQQAIGLAQASGVLVDKTGHLSGGLKDATIKADAYADANLRAQRPTSQLATDMQGFANKTLTATTRVTDLTDALKLFFDPANTADQDLITLKNDQLALAKALDASGGKTGLLTKKQRDARGAFDTYISQVAQAAQDAFTATGKTSSYTKIINDALPVLEKAAGHNQALRKQIQDLIDTEHKMKSENVAIHVSGTGSFRISSGIPIGDGKRIRNAAGGLVTGGVPGTDSVPILAMPGEVVVPTSMVRAGAVDHLRGALPGFADGGVVGHYSGALPGLNKWLQSENSATIRAMSAAVAAAFRQSLQSTGTGTGGSGVARWAPLILRVLAMLGQSPSNLGPVEHRMAQESGGNPRAINLWDSNAAAGDPSRGLMQTIGSTFNAYAGPFRSLGIYNPEANIYAGLNYALHRYPGRSLASVMLQPGGYDHGGYLPPGLSLAYNGTGRPEKIPDPTRPEPRSGPLVNIEHFHAREAADVSVLAQQVSWRITASGF